MKILFYFGHPAQYLFLRETIGRLRGRHQVSIFIKTKDVLEELLNADGVPYVNILAAGRKNSKVAIAWSLCKRIFAVVPHLVKERPDLLISTDASLAQLGWLFHIDRITITEDDYEVIKTLGDVTYPFTQTILCPEVCTVGKWQSKKIGYPGYMKLGYLHPNVFKFNPGVALKYGLSAPYVIIRLVKLAAHHDFGIHGIDSSLLDRIIGEVTGRGMRVLISSESELSAQYLPYKLHISPSDMHQVLSRASMLICDSQSMSVEAAMLGIPSIRYSSFAGKISVLEELEHKYDLTYGIAPPNGNALIAKLGDILDTADVGTQFLKKRNIMLEDKVDVSAFLHWFIENYPASIGMFRNGHYFRAGTSAGHTTT